MDWLRNDYLVITLIVLIALAVVFAPQLHAAPATPAVECVEWAKAGPWVITRCEDWQAGETCFMANSGMLVCNFE